MEPKKEAEIAAVMAGYVSESDHAKAVANARKIGLLRAAEVAEEFQPTGAGTFDGGVALVEFAARLRAEAEE